MKRMISENKWKLILSSILILFPQVIAVFMGETLYWLPIQCLVIHWICLLIVFWDWRKRPQGKQAMNLLIWICPVLSIAGSSVILLIREGQVSQKFAPMFMFFGFGIMFLLIGNYLPKIPQNRTMGIKSKWALEDEENWNATHRLGGKVWVACGFGCMICGLFPFSGFSVGIFIVLVVSAAAIPMIYSWRFYRKRLQAGEISKAKISRKSILITGVLIMATVIYFIWVLFSGNMTISYQDDGFTIHASGWEDYQVRYSDIDEITYESDGVSDGENGRRTNGFGNLKMSMGEFYNDRFGDYICYTFQDCQACVVLHVKGKVVVINGEDPVATEKIFETLESRCEERTAGT